MRTFFRWLLVFVAATAVDLFVRFGLPFRMDRVLWTEAVLFPATGLVFLVLFSRGAPPAGFKRAIQIFIIASFFLAGFRSGLWAVGLPVGTVNLLVLTGALVAWLAFRVFRSREGSGVTVDQNASVIAGLSVLVSLGC